MADWPPAFAPGPARPSSVDFLSPSENREDGFFPPAMKNPQGTAGRPAHSTTGINRRLVELLAAEALPQSEICRVLEIDAKTLRKHYRLELDRGAAKLQAKLVEHLLRLTNGKGAVALRAIIFLLRARFGWSRYVPAARLRRSIPRALPPQARYPGESDGIQGQINPRKVVLHNGARNSPIQSPKGKIRMREDHLWS